MLRSTILFYDHLQANRRDATRILSATGSQCSFPNSLEELKEVVKEKKFSVQVLDIEGHRYLSDSGVNLGKSPTIVLSQEKLGTALPYLKTMETFTNFVAKNKDGRLSARDLLVAVSKILYMDIFGVKKYLNWGASNRIFHIRDSTTRADYIEAVTNFCRSMSLRKSLIQNVHILCEELLMNALYDAPRDENGVVIYANMPRTQKVLLEPENAARLEVTTDGERLAVSVSDPYGAISRDVVLAYFSKCFTGGDYVANLNLSGGAGLGLYFCLNSVSNFTINVQPGQRSEFIGLFDINLSVKEHIKSHTSFHFFTTENQASQFDKITDSNDSKREAS